MGSLNLTLCKNDKRLITGECIEITTAEEYLTLLLESYRHDPPLKMHGNVLNLRLKKILRIKNVIMRV